MGGINLVFASFPEVHLARRVLGGSITRSVLGALVVVTAIGNADAAETKIETLSLARIPEATTIEIRHSFEDDLGLTFTLAGYFSDVLMGWGYILVAGDAELIFRFVAEEPSYARLDDHPQLGDFRAEGKRSNKLRANTLFVSLAEKSTLAQSDSDTYRLRVSVARQGRPPLWSGYIERLVKGADRRSTYLSMAKAIIAHWGRTYPALE